MFFCSCFLTRGSCASCASCGSCGSLTVSPASRACKSEGTVLYPLNVVMLAVRDVTG